MPDALTPPLVPSPLIGGSPLYFSGEDGLNLLAINSLTGVIVNLTGRFLPKDSTSVRSFNLDVTPPANRTASSRSIMLGEGWLLDCRVLASSGAPQHGQTWVRVGIVRGGPSVGIDLSYLCHGYVTLFRPIGYPLLSQDAPLDGPGALRSVTGSTPAAGANISETVPTGARWQLIAASMTLVVDATVATRVVSYTFDDGAAIYAAGSAQQNQTASQTIRYTVAPGASSGFLNSDNKFAVPAPPNLMLAAGHRIRTTCANLQAADQFSAPQMLVREWIAGE